MDTSLEDRVRLDPPLSWEQCVWILLCICRGLVHLHSQSLIHRDVKSQNVLLNGFASSDLDTTASHAKVADFGTARADDHNKGESLAASGLSSNTHAFTKMVVGTTAYMPVEYIQLGHFSEKTDAFAFGIIVIEMLVRVNCVQARAFVDEHEGDGLLQVLKERAQQGGWPRDAAVAMSNVAFSCTRRTKARATPAELLGQIESAHHSGSGVDSADEF
jgi:hypothetical protein